MSAANLADVVSTIRTMVGDTGVGRESQVRDERLDGVDGTNKRFTTLFFPVIPGSMFQLRKTTNGVTSLLTLTTDYTLDDANGAVTMVVAPGPGAPPGDPIDVLQATYAFLWFATDPNYYEFIIQAAREVGVVPNVTLSTPALRAADAITKLDDNLFDAVISLAASIWNRRRSIELATRFDASAGGQTVGAQTPSKAFDMEADRLYKLGIQLRDDYYKRRGRREAPASSLGNFQGLQVGYTPRR